MSTYRTYRLKDNPQGCVDERRRDGRTCRECYWSQVRNGQWAGGERCWNAQCLVAAGDGR